ncbi:hypothetical protein FISHEDRAFT_68971 [Fistulina hepatica ATCC 64428]|uniref:Coatomer subunit epsilon n=1 Tax=Fistulina hepatica ATCC 64428 TaxID=1128425 RepID=A0A0D7ANC4_9AGAR|nr:hypothetical protein FISHEDRAFT_68971 [Fistulina hepatica ATCC 64428]
MDSSELYHIKQQFILGAYKALTNLSPDPSSSEYVPTLLYRARAYIALGDPQSAIDIIPSHSENVAFRAVIALAQYVQASDAADRESSLEALRDLSVEIEGDDVDGTDRDKAVVRVLAGTAFARAGEIEEALETLGVDTQDLEAVAVVVQIFLSINRPDLARKEFERSKQWAEDDLLLQLIESSIDLVTGRDDYSNPQSFYTEQLGNPSLSSPHILTSRGVVRILQGEIPAARSDLEEALQEQAGDAETLAACVVAAGLGLKRTEADELWDRLAVEHPAHPLVVDVMAKGVLFDSLVTKFEAPPLASVAAA